MTDPTAIPVLAPVLREAVGVLVELRESDSDSEVVEAATEVEVPSAALRLMSVEDASIVVEVSPVAVVVSSVAVVVSSVAVVVSSVAIVVERVAVVVKRVAVVDVDDLSSDEQLPNMLWHLIKSECQRHLTEFRGDNGQFGSTRIYLRKALDHTYPSPQYVAFLPQYPLAEQQSPNSLP
jgi:hypothetical protein